MANRSRKRRIPLSTRITAKIRQRIRAAKKSAAQHLRWSVGTRTESTATRATGKRGGARVRSYTRQGRTIRAHTRTLR